MDFLFKPAHKKVFWLLWVLCIIGVWSVLPYVRYAEILPDSAFTLKLFLMTTFQAALFFGAVCWLSYKIVPKTDLQPFTYKNPLKTIVYPSLIVGVLVGFALVIVDKSFFGNSLLSGTHPPFWAGGLASIYGAINEEVLMRLFLLTLFYFVIRKAFKVGNNKKTASLWIATILVAIVFGLGHLPAAFKLIPPSVFEVTRILVLNGLAGVVFGWLYWSRGLWAAMGAHFVTDLMLHMMYL